MRTALVLRFVLIGLGAALGVALIVHGNVVIGGLICAMAIVRLVMVLSMRGRRHQLMARRQARRQAMQQYRNASR
jgi:hypothetical protein